MSALTAQYGPDARAKRDASAADAELARAQAGEVEQKRRQLAAQEAGRMALSGFVDPETGETVEGSLSRIASDPELASRRGEIISNLGIRFGMDPTELARYSQLDAGLRSPLAAAFVPGQSQEQSVVYGGAAAGEGPLSVGQAFDVERSQGIFETGEETERLNARTNANAQIRQAEIQRDSNIQTAKIKEEGDTARHQTTLTETFTNTPPDQIDVNIAVGTSMKARLGREPTEEEAALARSRVLERYYNGEDLQSAADSVAEELVKPNTEQGGLNLFGVNIGGGPAVRVDPNAARQPVMRPAARRVEKTPGAPTAPGPARSTAPAGRVRRWNPALNNGQGGLE